MSGKAAPEAAKPLPDKDDEFIVTAVVPVDERVSVCAAGVFTATSPKSTLAELKVSAGPAGLSCRAKVFDAAPTLAVSVTKSTAVAGETDAVNEALVEPAATIAVAGTVTSESLLVRFTTNPPLPAAAFSVTMHWSVPVPEIAVRVQFSPLRPGTPVPLKLMIVDDPVDESVISVNWPVVAPAVAGSNCTFSVAVWPGVSVIGRLPPAIVKPVPKSDAALTVTAELPVEDRVSGCVTGELTGTLPKARLDALMPRAGIAAPNWTANVCATPPTLAVNVAACVEATGDTLAEKTILAAPAGTVTESGTVTARLLLARLTGSPPVSAAALSVTVQLSVPPPVIDPLVQLSALSTGTPVPLRLTEVEAPVEELLAMVSWPVAAPVAVGLNWTARVKLLFALTVTGMPLWPLDENDCPLKVNCEIVTDVEP